MMSHTISTDSKKKKIALTGVCVLYLYNMLYTFALPVMYPSMLSQYSLIPYYALFGVISVSMSCISTPLGGKLCDTIGRKRLFMTVGCLRLVLMFFCGIHTSPLIFSILYLSSSFLTGLMYAVPLSILSDLTTPDIRPRYFGIFGTITGVSLISGILLSGIITDLLGPFSMFFLFIPILLAALLMIGYGYKDRRFCSGTSLDYLGVVWMSLCLAGLIIWCNFGGSAFAWLSVPSVLLFLAFVCFFIFFICHEKHCADPLLDLSIFSNRNFTLSFLCGFMIAPMVSLCSGSLVLFGQVSLGLSSTISSTLALPKNIIYLALPPFLGIWVTKKVSHYRTTFLTCGLLITLASILCTFWTPSTTTVTIYLVMVIFGLATTCQSVVLQPYMQLTISPERVGIASALISFSTTLCSTLISAINTVYFNARYSISANIPQELQEHMSSEQLNQLIAPDTLKSTSALENLRSQISNDMLSLFDTAVYNLRVACSDVFRLMAVLSVVCGVSLIVLTLFLTRKEDSCGN